MGDFAAKARKGLALLRRRSFMRALVSGVAAATEHSTVLARTDAATVIDVGANKGQFSLAARAALPEARIIAFEPLPGEAVRYRKLLGGDPRVVLHEVALAAQSGSAQFYVTDRSDSSSLLEPTTNQKAAYNVSPSSIIEVPVRRLDEIVSLADCAGPVLLKIDVQGGELGVLEGCAEVERLDLLYLELSYVPLYRGQPLYDDVAVYLRDRGFALAGVFNQSTTAAFGPTQADFLFKRA